MKRKWTNQATCDANLEIRNDETSCGQLMYLLKKFPEVFALRQAMIETFGYKSGVDYQQLAEIALEEA